MNRIRMWLAVALAASALTGCAYSINGTPVPMAGGEAATSASTTSSSSGGAPKIAKQRTVAGVDPCKLLTADDLKPIGKLTKDPARKDDVIQESCQYVVDDGSAGGRSVVTALYQQYEQVRARQGKGHEEVVDGHSAWVYCDAGSGDMACTATIAVNKNRSVLVAMTTKTGVADQVLATMQPLMKAVLSRMPLA
ncbi:DUF3558 family protein [Saccharothrix violaceirubra]|uniref:DUF3558 domain-containing protein n=1 Tax=Saccharothrix violaceirubra TaxID=413306 RepID=A0A7W7T7I4_9PSEU|nr:DUF3558 family protein [Saccharothrix violaceirubra]MBB4968004.1 hypothetical protein [Saccharothrix violaceirubra]